MVRTIERHHCALARWRELRLSHRVLQIRDELIHHRHGQALCSTRTISKGTIKYNILQTKTAHRNGNVHRGRGRDRVQMPATLAHDVSDLQHIERRAARRGERNDGRGRVPEHAQLRDLSTDPVRNRLRRGHDRLARLEVAAVAHVLHRGPRASDECTRADSSSLLE